MTDQRRARAEKAAKDLVHRLFRIGEHIDKTVVWEPEAFTADALIAFADAERKDERARCAKVCRNKASDMLTPLSIHTCERCATAIENLAARDTGGEG